jgi:hypothetical protein
MLDNWRRGDRRRDGSRGIVHAVRGFLRPSRAKIVYWHRALPPFDAEVMAEESRLVQEVARLDAVTCCTVADSRRDQPITFR